MDSAYDDPSRLRDRLAATRRRPAETLMGPAAMIGQVFAVASVPTTTGCYFAVHPVAALGAEAEGGAPTLTADASTTVFAYVGGGRVPVAGDNLICRFIGNRWVAERLLPGGGGGVAVPGCSCASLPATLTMHSSRPTSNGGMFQDGVSIVYGPTPSGYAGLGLGANSYLSTASFLDQYGDSFRYYFYCQANQFFLSRVYLHSTFNAGGNFEDGVRYTWTMTSYGNTCSAGSLTLGNGQIYSGGDASCIVTISG